MNNNFERWKQENVYINDAQRSSGKFIFLFNVFKYLNKYKYIGTYIYTYLNFKYIFK